MLPSLSLASRARKEMGHSVLSVAVSALARAKTLQARRWLKQYSASGAQTVELKAVVSMKLMGTLTCSANGKSEAL